MKRIGVARIGVALAMIGATACSDLVIPRRAVPYEYRLFRVGQTGAVDTLSFNWPRSFLPVRIWVGADDVLRAPIAEAIARWEGAFLYGEFRAELVSDSSRADIIVRNTLSPGGVGLSITRLSGARPECIGETVLDDSGFPTTLVLPLRIFIAPRFGTDSPGLAECYTITATHEIGHALGIIDPRHSPDPNDVMFSNPVLNGISERDRATAELVYHIQPTLTPSGRR